MNKFFYNRATSRICAKKLFCCDRDINSHNAQKSKQMKYSLANRIFMFFPDKLMLNYLVALRVAWQHPGTCWEVMGLNQWMSPLGACITITQSITVTSFHSLTRWRRSVFPLPPFPIMSSQQCCMLFSFGSFVFECPHLYWARKIFNFDPCKLWSQNMIY